MPTFFFETLNARGKELAVSDLVKNRLYSEAGEQVTRVQQLWEQMEAELVRRPIPEFLRHFWIVKKLFRTVANFSFRYFIIGNQSPGNLERVSNGIAAGIRTGEYATPLKVAEAFRAINADASFRSDFKLAVIPKARAKIARYTLG